MTFLLATLIVAVLVVVLTRGSFTQLAQLPVRWPAPLFVALALQVLLDVVELPDDRLDDLGFGLLLASYLLLLAFCVVNARITGLAVIGVGVALNALVIGLNHGMPTRPYERERAGRVVEVPIERDAKHRPEEDDDRLLLLSDQIVPPDPIDEVISVGDLVIGAGLIVLCYTGSRRARPRRNASTTAAS